MRVLKSLFAATILELFLISSVFSSDLDNSRLNAIMRSVTEPRLLYPSNEEVVLSGKDYLEFRWASYRDNLVKRNYHEFRLYKGEELTGPNLIFKKSLSAYVYSIKVDSSLFEDNQVYTWVVIQFFLRAQGSNGSVTSFKVIKK